MTINDISSLTTIISNNTAVFAVIGIFAAIGNHFQSKIDTEAIILKDMSSVKKFWSKLFYRTISLFSYIAVVSVSLELVENLKPAMDLNINSSIFVFSVIVVMVLLNLLVIVRALGMMWEALVIILDQI